MRVIVSLTDIMRSRPRYLLRSLSIYNLYIIEEGKCKVYFNYFLERFMPSLLISMSIDPFWKDDHFFHSKTEGESSSLFQDVIHSSSVIPTWWTFTNVNGNVLKFVQKCNGRKKVYSVYSINFNHLYLLLAGN